MLVGRESCKQDRMSTLALLATPAAKGLYARAIVQSGGGWFPPVTLAQREAAGGGALAALGPAKAAAAGPPAPPGRPLAKGLLLSPVYSGHQRRVGILLV